MALAPSVAAYQFEDHLANASFGSVEGFGGETGMSYFTCVRVGVFVVFYYFYLILASPLYKNMIKRDCITSQDSN